MDDLIINFVVFVWIPFNGMVDHWALYTQERIKQWLNIGSY